MVLVNSTKHFRRNNTKHTQYFLQNGEEKKISQLILLGHNNSNYKFDKNIIFKNFKEIELQKKCHS